MNKSKRHSIFLVIAIVLIITSITTSFFLGYLAGNYGFSPNVFSLDNVINKNNGKPENVDFSLFWDAWSAINEKYNGELDSNTLLYGAIAGMAEATGDPYTTYLSPEEIKLLDEELSGSFEGIGAEIGMQDNQIVIIAPLENTPAKAADLRAGDKVIQIDGKSTEGMSVVESVSLIKGEKGSEVTLKIIRGEELLEKKIKRDTIIIHTVTSELKGNIGYIKINSFSEDTADDVKSALIDFEGKNVKGYVVDVRGNPGGYLDSSVDIASFFVDSGVIVWERTKGKDKASKTSEKRITKKPVVILIDEGSASASEIFAGALRDRINAPLIGEKSYGKGSVQIINDLKSGSLKITIAEWLTPNKTRINNNGLEPTIKVELTEEDYINKKDPQLDRALDEINKK